MALDPDLVERALQEATKRAENLDYFFEKLTSPEWIEPLSTRGFFSEPPPQEVDDKGYIRAPGWSASRYLARMAAVAPDAVVAVIRSITSNNERIHEDFADAAIAMPAESARDVALLEAAWIARQDHLYYLLPAKTAALIEYLATNSEIDTALKLFQVLFTPLADKRDSDWILRHPQSRFTDWEYDRLLNDVSVKIVPSAPVALVAALADMLDAAMQFMIADGNNELLPDSLWRTRIANEDDCGTSVEDSLVSTLRDVVLIVREANLLSDEDLVRALALRHSSIYRRIIMHAFSIPPRPTPAIVEPFVMDLDELADPEPSVEYRELLRSEAERLAPAQLAELLSFIERGPDLDRYRELSEQYTGHTPAAEEIRQHVSRWQVGRLRLLEAALPPEWATRRAELASEVGDEDIAISGEISTFVGPTSPVSADQLQELDDNDLADYLVAWNPDGRWDAPSVEGLARTFATFAELNPWRASSILDRLRDARPAYVQWALHGLEQAVRKGNSPAWGTVLDLMDWIAGQPRERLGGRDDDYSDVDPGWVWTRRAVASLLEAGLNVRGIARISYSERHRVWRVISLIATDPDPTPEDEEQFGGSNMDPATLALNTTRPRALRAAIAYALWAFQESYPNPKERDRPGHSFLAEVPEVSELLASHLDPRIDPSEAVRGAIGQQFANLFALDSQWSTEIAEVLFPHADSSLREAAWGAFVIYNAPYDNVLAAIRPQYMRSAELAGSSSQRFRWTNGEPRARLGEHIAAFYWRGVIDLEDELFTMFWVTATQQAKAHLVEVLGRWVTGVAEIDDAVLARLTKFWEMALTASSVSARQSEVAAFGWWFSAQSLPAEWRLQQLTGLLEAGVRPEPTFRVAEVLPTLAPNHPRQSVVLLRRLLELELEHERWTIDAWRERIESVLQTALSSTDDEACRVADETVNWLGALGYRDFRKLIA